MHKYEGFAVKVDYTGYSLEELEQALIEVNMAISKIKQRRLTDLRDEMRLMVEERGFSLSDVFEGELQPNVKSGKPKYANPEDSNMTWTGRGRNPGWYLAAIEAGLSPDDMKV